MDQDTVVMSQPSRHLFLVKSGKHEDWFCETTRVWEKGCGIDGKPDEIDTTWKIGRMLLSAGGTNDPVALKTRIQSILVKEFGCAVESIELDQWSRVIHALEWIAGESAQFGDVVSLLSAVSELPAPLHLRVVLKLKASYYLEHRLDNPEEALKVALGAHALSPLSTQTAGLVCDKIRALEKRLPSDKTKEYWKQLVSIYIKVLSEYRLEKDRQVAVLLMLGWVFSHGLHDMDNGYKLVARAHKLDPNNQAIAEKLALLAKKCQELRPLASPEKRKRGDTKASPTRDSGPPPSQRGVLRAK